MDNENIRIDCYLSIVKDFKLIYPNAHFEIITRKTYNHILSPSSILLQMVPLLSFKDYTIKFFKEIDNLAAMKKLKELLEISKEKKVFLVCYEKNQYLCHRSLVKQTLEKIENIETHKLIYRQCHGLNCKIHKFLTTPLSLDFLCEECREDEKNQMYVFNQIVLNRHIDASFFNCYDDEDRIVCRVCGEQKRSNAIYYCEKHSFDDIAEKIGTNFSLIAKEIMEERIYCEICGEIGTDVHHILPVVKFAPNWRLIFTRENMKLLCKDCHKKKHENKNKKTHPEGQKSLDFFTIEKGQ